MMRKYDPKWFYNLRLRLVVAKILWSVHVHCSKSKLWVIFYFLNIWNFRMDLDKLDCCSGRRKACCCYILRLFGCCWWRLQLVCAPLPITWPNKYCLLTPPPPPQLRCKMLAKLHKRFLEHGKLQKFEAEENLVTKTERKLGWGMNFGCILLYFIHTSYPIHKVHFSVFPSNWVKNNLARLAPYAPFAMKTWNL